MSEMRVNYACIALKFDTFFWGPPNRNKIDASEKTIFQYNAADDDYIETVE